MEGQMSTIQLDNTNRLLDTLQRLLAIPGAELENPLSYACNAVADALHADKVDAFLYDEARDSLVALGTSSTPLSSLEKKLGLDVLQVSNGGRVAYVFKTGETFVTGRLREDAEELRGIKDGLKINSKIGVPLEVGGRRQGMMMIASLQPDFFQPADVEFAESVAHWVGMIAHRAELVQEVTRNAVEQGRRQVAEELITVLAHDLRNYITPISARVHLIRGRAKEDNRRNDVKDADLSLKAVGRLNQLISDILDIARLDQGIFQIDVEALDLAESVADVSRSLSSPDHELLLDAADQIVVAADPQRVRQSLENLVANAIQHSPDSAPIRVLVRSEHRHEKCWGIVEVHNEGPGIPVELMPRIFERFVAGPGSRGLGLGLYLAKRIAVAHGGDLAVDSPPGKGTRFLLQLPCYNHDEVNPHL
jgi:two-component system OmpR family sensor kinase